MSKHKIGTTHTSGAVIIQPKPGPGAPEAEYPGVYLSGEDALLRYAPALDALVNTAYTAHQCASYYAEPGILQTMIPMGMVVDQARELLSILQGCNVHPKRSSELQVLLPLDQAEPSPGTSPDALNSSSPQPRKLTPEPVADGLSPHALKVHQVGTLLMLEGPENYERKVEVDGVLLTGSLQALRHAGGMIYQDVVITPASLHAVIPDLDARMLECMQHVDEELDATSDLDLCHLDLRALHKTLQDARRVMGLLPGPEITVPERQEDFYDPGPYDPGPGEEVDEDEGAPDQTPPYRDQTPPYRAIYTGGEGVVWPDGASVVVMHVHPGRGSATCAYSPPHDDVIDGEGIRTISLSNLERL